MKTCTSLSLFVLVALLLVGCAGKPVVPQSKNTATPIVQRTATPAAPAVTVKPNSASANTQILVAGSGFPADTRLRLYLGPASASNILYPYANPLTDAEGNLAVVFVVPDKWPNGESITDAELTVVVANEDLSLKVTTSLSFQPAVAPQPTPTLPQPTPVPTAVITPTLNAPSARVDFEFLNVRSGPGINYSLVTKLDQNASMSLLGRNDDATWVRIRLPDGREGWVYTQYIQASVAINSLPLASTQPIQGPGTPLATASPMPANDQEAAVVVAVSFYTQWASGPGPNGNLDQVLLYVSKSLADQIRADNSALLRLVGVSSRPRYTDVEIRTFDSATVLARATLQLDSGNQVVDTTLRKENGVWVITQFQPVTQ